MKKANLVVAGLLVAFAVLGGWTAWWFFLATYGERLARAATEESARPRLAFSAVERFGFPFEVGLRFRDARATAAWGAGVVDATAPVAVATFRPWRFDDIQVFVPEGVDWTVTGVAAPDIPPGASVGGSAKRAEARLSADPSPVARILLHDIVAEPPTSAPVRAAAGTVVWRKQSETAQSIDLAFHDIALADDAFFGPTAEAAEASIVATGPLPRSAAPREIARWRDAGGEVRVETARVVWGALDLEAAGALGLDQAYRVAGRLDLGLANYKGLVSRLEEEGHLTSQGAAAASALLAMSALGNGGRARAPLVLADGKATLVGMTVARLLPICACR